MDGLDLGALPLIADEEVIFSDDNEIVGKERLSFNVRMLQVIQPTIGLQWFYFIWRDV